MSQRASTRHVWRSTRAITREVQRLYLWAAVAVIVSTLITLSGPALVRYGVNQGIAKDDLHPLNVAAVVLLCLAVVKPFVVRTQTLLAATAGERFWPLRTAAFEKLQVLPLGFFERERTGVLVSRLTSDVQALTEFLREALVEVVGSGLQIVLTIGVLVILSPTLAAVSLIALPVLTLSSWAFHHSAGGVYLAIRDRVAETLTRCRRGSRACASFRRSAGSDGRWRRTSRAAGRRSARGGVRRT